jgi:hypothetical protein
VYLEGTTSPPRNPTDRHASNSKRSSHRVSVFQIIALPQDYTSYVWRSSYPGFDSYSSRGVVQETQKQTSKGSQTLAAEKPVQLPRDFCCPATKETHSTRASARYFQRKLPIYFSGRYPELLIFGLFPGKIGLLSKLPVADSFGADHTYHNLEPQQQRKHNLGISRR